MKQTLKLLPLLLSSFLFAVPDLTVVGPLIYADGLGRLALGCIDCLKDDISINFIPTAFNQNDMPKDFHRFIQYNSHMANLFAGKVAILFDPLWYKGLNHYDKIPHMSKIKIAYSMIESSAIVPEWVSILNNKFDSVVVPDEFLVKVYKQSGVKIPIFVLPHGMLDLNEFFKMPVKRTRNKVFTFGISGALYDERKNHILVLEAFAKEFGNNSKFKLRVHARLGSTAMQRKISEKIKALGIKNIEFIYKNLSPTEYREFLSSLDAYVLLSAGEGFSVGPREALALGIPTIISDNTAHSTICKTGFVLPVPANISKPAYYAMLGQFSGDYQYCSLDAARLSLRQVYEQYNIYLNKAKSAKPWLEQYLYKNRRPKYLALVKPREIKLDSYNRVDDYCITTNSQSLYDKYKSIM